MILGEELQEALGREASCEDAAVAGLPFSL